MRQHCRPTTRKMRWWRRALTPPAGWEVAVGPTASGVTVQVASTGAGSASTVKLNGEAVPLSSPEARLRQLLAHGGQILVSADAALPFGEVAQVLDVCHLP